MKQDFHEAVSIVHILQNAGYQALFVGGWVRDKLLQREQGDIDIATSATPEQVMLLFPHSIPVGVQFGVVRVRTTSAEYEIASLRSDDAYVNGRHPSSVHFHASIHDDVQRRDFTINGLFYDPCTDTIYDYVNGRADIEQGIIRTIGIPLTRFSEDLLRILRALRFKNDLGFTIEADTWAAMRCLCDRVVAAVSPERIWQELQKMLQRHILDACLHDMMELGLLWKLFPYATEASVTAGLSALHRYQGHRLILALCHIIPQHEYPQLIRSFPLSHRDQVSLRHFATIGTRLQSRDEYERVCMYALPDSHDLLEAWAATQTFPQRFLMMHAKKERLLLFWIRQEQHHAYRFGGAECHALGIQGKECGEYIRKVFQESCRRHIRSMTRLMMMVQSWRS